MALDPLNSSNLEQLALKGLISLRTSLGARSFSVASPKIWNSLPPALYSYNCPDTFHWHLKTHYFQQAISVPIGTSLFAPQIWHLLTVCACYPAIRSIGRDTKFTVCLFFMHYVRLRISQPGLYRSA